MKNTTLTKVNEELAADKVEVRRYHSTGKFAGANYLVRVKTGKPQTMSDGTEWDGWEHVGHYRYIADAVGAARDTANERR